jgi:hypothetical protein
LPRHTTSPLSFFYMLAVTGRTIVEDIDVTQSQGNVDVITYRVGQAEKTTGDCDCVHVHNLIA